jgi:hypothetical protein
MLLLYVTLLIELFLVQRLLRWRVARLEKRFDRVAAEADALVKQSQTRGGNTNRPDPLVGARQQYQLARLAMKRDRVEARYDAWQAFSERFAAFRGRLAGFKGKLLPYLVGVADVTGAIVALHKFGIDVEQVRAMIGM